jgi:hypothetical protein
MKGFIGISIVVLIVIAMLYYLGSNRISEGFQPTPNNMPTSVSVSMYRKQLS